MQRVLERLPRNRAVRQCVLPILLIPAFAISCPLPENAERETAYLHSVHDGDSLRLADERRIRLVGINAPELARDGEPAQPLAKAARDELRALVEPGDKLQLVYDRERKDHYGRTLAHVYTATGISLEAQLLRRGLAFHIAVPPNLMLAACLSEHERQARQAGHGLWSHPEWKPRAASTLSTDDTGFQRVIGTVKDVTLNRDLWLELDGPLVLRVSEADLDHFGPRPAADWLGRRVEVRGWVVDRSDSGAARRGFKPLLMPLRSPYAIETLPRQKSSD